MSQLDVLTSSLIIVGEVAITLAIVVGFVFIFSMLQRKKRSREVKRFNAHFSGKGSAANTALTEALTSRGFAPDNIDSTAANIAEQQSLLASSIVFAYKGKGKTPLVTVKEKLALLVNACLQAAVDNSAPEDNSLQQRIEQLEAERENLLAEIAALKALQNNQPPAETPSAATDNSPTAEVSEQQRKDPPPPVAEPTPEIYWETENLNDDA